MQARARGLTEKSQSESKVNVPPGRAGVQGSRFGRNRPSLQSVPPGRAEARRFGAMSS
jgi:hypothetical protein